MAGHTGQTLNDRLNAARYALAGQGLARVVCKATTEEVIGPKKKHLDYLLQCTHEPNVSIPQLANLLIERTNHSSWVVVFKALVTVHHLMCYGNERFTQYLASSNCTFQLSNFLDKNGVKGYEMSTFIRRYAKYLNEKALSYRTVAFDFTKIKRGKEDGSLRSMNTDKLIKTIPTLQSQVDSLLEFDCTANDLTNGVINAAFMLLFRDLIRLFACYNDGIINCLEKYFDMNKKHARDALDIYKKFLIRMDKVAEFLKVAENVGIDKGEIPDLTKAPSSLLEALEQHLSQLEGKKEQTNSKSSSSAQALQMARTAHSNANGSIPSDSFNGGFKEGEASVKKALEEEEQMLNKLKIKDSHDLFDSIDSSFDWKQEKWLDLEKHLQDKEKDTDKKPNNPFLSMSPTAETKTSPTTENKSQEILDLFNETQSNSNIRANNQSLGKASDDLLFLSNANPFADILNAAITNAPPPQASFPSLVPNMAPQPMVPLIHSSPFNGITNNTSNGNVFATDDGFAAAFGKTDTTSASEGDQMREEEVRDQLTASLPLPDDRSVSPSPTRDVIKGAGTTPILAVPPDPGFGEDSGIDESNSPRGNSPVAISISAPPPSGENSPFGQSFESTSIAFNAVFEDTSTHVKTDRPHRPPPPHETSSVIIPERPPPPVMTNISQNMASDQVLSEDETGFGEQLDGGPPPRPPVPSAVPNIPFAAFDMNQQYIQQQLLFQQQMAMSSPQMQQKPPKKSSAFEDLDFAMRETMAKPQKPVGVPQQTPVPGVVYVPPGAIPPAGYVVTPGMPSYGVPTGVAGFDAFGDVLQPQQLGNKSGQTIPIGPTLTQTSTSSANTNQSLFKGDLDSSLASLAQNLDINGPKGAFKKPGQQWSSPKNTGKTGAPVQTQQTGWAPNQQISWNTGGLPLAAQPAMIPAGGQWAPSSVQSMMNSMPMTYGVQMRPAMVGGMVPPVGSVLPGAVQVLPATTAQRPVNPGLANTQSDPFGAL